MGELLSRPRSKRNRRSTLLNARVLEVRPSYLRAAGSEEIVNFAAILDSLAALTAYIERLLDHLYGRRHSPRQVLTPVNHSPSPNLRLNSRAPVSQSRPRPVGGAAIRAGNRCVTRLPPCVPRFSCLVRRC